MGVDGSWHLTLDSAMGKQEFDFELNAEGTTLTGTGTAEGREVVPEIIGGALDGDTATWKLKVRKPMRITLTFTVEVSGDEMTGKSKAGIFGSFPVVGRRN
ncbi:hypothetical protein BTM25_31600 [Actinomadura rubteroloni]|uniref:Uncharacterized protein n=1 Tax=Actinomadura rubteroloni TaxID=1926885 RepID=A0A2P4UHL8_9ACTN|nr:hypothetical protein [Actinomadura rubteroloni]POM24531.1 hypothetical protein BTM25_31600 [Actinomadura rubteroloni]